MVMMLVWDWCGEQPVQFWRVPQEHEALVRQAHGQSINADDLPETAAVFTINDWLASNDNPLIEIAQGEPLPEPLAITEIVVCGFAP